MITMKRITCLVFAIVLLTCCRNRRQAVTDISYQMPTFTLLLMDSSTKICTTSIVAGKPTIMMYVSPDCEHCHRLTEQLLKNINALKETQIYFFTPLSLSEMKHFSNNFKLTDYPNITVAHDYEFAFYKFYHANAFPCTAVFDKEKKLVKVYKGEVEIEKILEAVRS